MNPAREPDKEQRLKRALLEAKGRGIDTIKVERKGEGEPGALNDEGDGHERRSKDRGARQER